MKKSAQKKTSRRVLRRKSPKKPPKKALKSFHKIVRKIKTRINRISSKPRFQQAPAPSESKIGAGSPQFPSARYGEDRMVLLVKDPWWIYAYWEVTPSGEAKVRNQIRRQGFQGEKTVLRVYDMTGVPHPPAPFFDIETGPAECWYVDVGRPDREWTAELGIRTREGHFFPILRSNRVRTPHFGLSGAVGESMLPDEVYRRLIGAFPSSSSWSAASQ